MKVFVIRLSELMLAGLGCADTADLAPVTDTLNGDSANTVPKDAPGQTDTFEDEGLLATLGLATGSCGP
jgi:hypothetical protein